MKFIALSILSLLLFQNSDVSGQLENVRVETYYVSDDNDAKDTIGGHLGTGSKLHAVYGDERHPLVFSSTGSFFNHREEGVSFGKDFNRNRFETGTAPLDTYITLGQCSRSFSQVAYQGIVKENDTDGSIIG